VSAVTYHLTVRDVPGVLVRVAQVFSRRGCNIRAIEVVPQEASEWSIMTIVALDVTRPENVTKQLEKLVDVRDVQTAPRELETP